MNLLDNSLRAGAVNLWITVGLFGQNLRVEIGDDGIGIDAEDAKHVFDPFFTKRADGSGTGLGLYLSRKMIAEQGGNLWYRPRPGGGAVFTVEVPVVR
jgi:two-component system sensor histidine kinase HupT/HoxJ